LFATTFAFKLVFISRLLLALYAAILLLAMIAFRLAARRLGDPLRRTFGGYREFLLVGDASQVGEVAQAIEANEKRGMRIFGFARISAANENSRPPAALRREYPVFSLAQLPELVRRHVIDEVVFAVAKGEIEKIEDAFMLCEEEGVKTRVLLNFFPQAVSRVYLDRLEEMPLLTFTTTPENEYLLLLKRALDFAMALVLLVVLSPLLLLLAVIIRLTSPGPVLYRQTRCGLGGRKFTVYKFRSMHANADLRREELAALNELDGPVFKIRNDPRCTTVGRLMRKFSLDELPQLVNILTGDMSFVGPRPPLPEEVEKYAGWQRRRLRMQPGLTCLWALEGRNQLNFRRWMELDLFYIDNWSPGLDLKILLKTIPVVLLGRGAS
jgi:exopolysaccharide biosynthesis polyprenyl glycosylphosphotransferase